MTICSKVKAKLIANSDIGAGDIDVSSSQAVVNNELTVARIKR